VKLRVKLLYNSVVRLFLNRDNSPQARETVVTLIFRMLSIQKQLNNSSSIRELSEAISRK